MVKDDETMTSLVEVKGLQKYFPLKTGFFSRERGYVKAVDGVSFVLNDGEILGLAGESGSGKTTLGRLIVGLVEPDDGSILFLGRNIFSLSEERLRSDAQIIFQNPFESLNPRKSIRYILSRPLMIHDVCQRDKVERNILQLLSRVGLNPPESFIDRYPHELSGGQRQRIGIARAISVAPKFIVADEPVSALDLSTRGQILNIVKDLQKDLGVAFLFITHELCVLRSIAQRVAIMYLGRIVEINDVETIFDCCMHPYTEALLNATPVPNPEKAQTRERIILKGEIPSNINPPSGCYFHPRCPHTRPKCSQTKPELVEYEAGKFMACHFPLSG